MICLLVILELGLLEYGAILNISPAGRLSKDDIERMVQDAEKYKNDDEQQRERIQAKNALESYAYNMKSTSEDEKLKDKLSDDDRKKITDKCNEVISWLDNNQVRLGRDCRRFCNENSSSVMSATQFSPRCGSMPLPTLARSSAVQERG